MSFRGSLLFVVRLHTNQQSKRTSVQMTTPALAVQGQFCWKRRTSGWYNSFHELNKRQQFVGTIRNRTNGIYFLSTLISHTPTTTTTTTNCRPMSTHPLIRTNNKRNKETTSTTTTSSNNAFSPSSSTPWNDERSQGITTTNKRRINNNKTTSTSTNTSRRNNNRNTTTSMDLEQCMAQDDYNVNVIASRYGMCTIPLAISLEALVSYMIDDTITSYSTSSQMSIDLLSTLVILHTSWLLTLSKCIHDLHTQADPLSTLAQQWSGAATTVDNNTRRSIPFNPHDEHNTPPSLYDPFMTQEEWDDARQTNKRRLRHSFDAGLFFSVSILLASYPFLPLDVLFDDEEDEVVFLDPTISEMTLSSSDMVLDYGTLGICFIASLLTGRKAYKAWKALQHTPPTELPAKIYLRRSAAFANE